VKNFLESKRTRVVILALGGIAVALLIFGAGAAIGYRKAIFSSDWGRNYERNFYGVPPPGMMGMPIGIIAPRGPNAHGVTGEVIDVASSSFSVKDPDNDERSIAITSATVIRDMDQTVSVGQIAPGSRVVVIGAPNSNGQVEARFVRVFPQ
jgi:RNase P/RNase MRP subunit p29